MLNMVQSFKEIEGIEDAQQGNLNKKMEKSFLMF